MSQATPIPLAILQVALVALTACGGGGGGGAAGTTGDIDVGSEADADVAPADASDAAGDSTDSAFEETGAPDAGEDVEPDAPEPELCEPVLDCEDFESACEGEGCPALSAYTPVVPGEGLPAEVEPQLANNNLDVVEHEGRTYLAFRTAPFHFASDAARLYVVSSDDLQTWSFEADFHMETDLREPRLLSWDGRLFLYFAVLGDNPVDFEPQGMMVSEREAAGQWSEATWFYDEGFIPWRTRTVDGVPYMITYSGGEDIYDFTEGSVDVRLLTTDDGVTWTPVVEGQPTVLNGGASETAFAFLDDGSLVAVARNELGDADTGWGSKVCTAPADDLGAWDCVGDPRKYDSPIMFRHGEDVYLVARRNVTETGHYDLGGEDLEPSERTRRNLLAYSSKPKRCSLWQVDPDDRTVAFVLDLPSRGDTCFPGVVQIDPHTFHVYNYSSPPEWQDLTWLEGQGRHTLIYRVTLSFSE